MNGHGTQCSDEVGISHRLDSIILASFPASLILGFCAARAAALRRCSPSLCWGQCERTADSCSPAREMVMPWPHAPSFLFALLSPRISV